MNLPVIMGGLVKSAEELTEMRIEANDPKKEKHQEEVDLTKDKDYEDDESDEDFDDADEEVTLILSARCC